MEQGICPVCNGTGRANPMDALGHELSESAKKSGWYGYDVEDDKVNCYNCGGQRQWGSPTGKVNLRRDNGQPCVHEYTGQNLGRCYTGYTCKHCGDYYTIDSGD